MNVVLAIDIEEFFGNDWYREKMTGLLKEAVSNGGEVYANLTGIVATKKVRVTSADEFLKNLEAIRYFAIR